MKNFLLILLFTLFCLPVFSAKRALLVGIGNYPPNSGWQKISSVNDIQSLKGILSYDYRVEMLVDQQATKKGIYEAFRRLTLHCSKGDTVLVHFSCHGQQMLSIHSEEPDGLDEALVPYDAKSEKSPVYNGENHLLDNDLAGLLASLRKQLGVQGLLVVTLDACYSDSNHKGENNADSIVYRGGSAIFGSNDISEDSLIVVKKRQLIKDESSIESMDNASNIVMLSACESYQKNREVRINGQGYGSLSYSMVKSFETCSMDDITMWLDEVYKQMSEYAYTQSPQIRNTIGYIPPDQRISKDNDVESCIESDTIMWPIFAICIFVLLALMLTIWIWKKKKRK